jgi:hypothetical protein
MAWLEGMWLGHGGVPVVARPSSASPASEVAVSRQMFAEILLLITQVRLRPHSYEQA